MTGRGQGRLADVRVTGTMESLEERKIGMTIGMTKGVNECQTTLPCTPPIYGWNTRPTVIPCLNHPARFTASLSLLFHRRAGHGHNFCSLQSHLYFGCPRFFPTLIHVPPSHFHGPSHHVDFSCVGFCLQTRPSHSEAPCTCPFPASVAPYTV